MGSDYCTYIHRLSNMTTEDEPGKLPLDFQSHKFAVLILIHWLIL